MNDTATSRIGQPDSPATREEIAALHAAATSANNLDMTRVSLTFALRQIERVESFRARQEQVT